MGIAKTIIPRAVKSLIARRLHGFHLSALKPEAEMISEAFRGCYDFDKPENITDLYRQSNRTN